MSVCVCVLLCEFIFISVVKAYGRYCTKFYLLATKYDFLLFREWFFCLLKPVEIILIHHWQKRKVFTKTFWSHDTIVATDLTSTPLNHFYVIRKANMWVLLCGISPCTGELDKNMSNQHESSSTKCVCVCFVMSLFIIIIAIAENHTTLDNNVLRICFVSHNIVSSGVHLQSNVW